MDADFNIWIANIMGLLKMRFIKKALMIYIPKAM
jgi:hypothetical protein